MWGSWDPHRRAHHSRTRRIRPVTNTFLLVKEDAMNHVNDPKWTAFVLDELETPDKDFIKEVLERDPSALETVERLREISALIEESLKDLSPLELSASQREEILAASSGAASPKKRFDKPRSI